MESGRRAHDDLDIHQPRVAYFSMEIALHRKIPTYSGGLGVLAGDTIRSAADLGLPMVAVTLLYRRGYMNQSFDDEGHQIEAEALWDPDRELKSTHHSDESSGQQSSEALVSVDISGRRVWVRAFRFDVRGQSGYIVPVYFLDTDLAENDPADRSITHALYSGDASHRLKQEIVLGIAGVRILDAEGFKRIERYHMNEGHAAFLILELQDRLQNFLAVRNSCVFTTHTPVASGHDIFVKDLVDDLLGSALSRTAFGLLAGQVSLSASGNSFSHQESPDPGLNSESTFPKNLNMTLLALSASGFANAVSRKHAEVSREMFPHFEIQSITNGVHHVEWTSESFRQLFDEKLCGWRSDPQELRLANRLPLDLIWDAHRASKINLINFIESWSGARLSVDDFTIGFARRMTSYKRALLILADVERLRSVAKCFGPLQIIFAGKAHPMDFDGKRIITAIHRAARTLDADIRITFIDNYDLTSAHLLTSGVDLWLNTPLPPLEASGTSGMKAALNGVPQLSTLDGWWLEGHIEGVTGWSIGNEEETFLRLEEMDHSHAQSLLDKLENCILPLYEKKRSEYISVMRHAIALNGSYFNTQRMVEQYSRRAYQLMDE